LIANKALKTLENIEAGALEAKVKQNCIPPIFKI